MISNCITPVLNSLIIALLGAGFVSAAEIDDTSMFVDAFTAYQNKDYPLAIQKITTLNQLFPDSPLRDVTLLLLTRSSLKSGDTALAAHSSSLFAREYGNHPLADRPYEELQPVTTLRNMQERAIPGNVAPAVTAATGGTSGRAVSPRIESSAITAEIRITGKSQVVEIGQTGTIPFQVINQGPLDEKFILEVNAPAEYMARLIIDDSMATQPASVRISKSGRLTGSITYQMPPQQLDGHKATITLLASSERFQHVVQTSDVQVVTAAPLIRVVARPLTLKPAQGEQLQYRMTLLNVGAIPGRKLTARIYLPEQIEFLDAAGSAFQRESADTVAFKVDTLEKGKLVEFTMNVKIRENCPIGQELRSKIEIVHEQLQFKELFTSLAAEVRKK